jgi:hypothetical protein
VTDTGFEVGLSFSDTPEKLEVPFSAVRGFYDPSVNFELEFDVKTDIVQPTPLPVAETKSAPKLAEAPKPTANKVEHPDPDKEGAGEPAAAKGADVVSLDAFRKK